MVQVVINGKEENIVFNNYVLFQFAKSIGVKTPNEAMQRLSILGGGEITVDGMDAFCHLLHEMVKAANKETKVTFEDCYEIVNSPETIEEVMKLLVDGLPQPETIKQSEGKQTQAA